MESPSDASHFLQIRYNLCIKHNPFIAQGSLLDLPLSKLDIRQVFRPFLHFNNLPGHRPVHSSPE